MSVFSWADFIPHFEGAGDALILVDVDTRQVTFANAKTREWTGLNQYPGQNLACFLQAEHLERWQELWTALAGHQPFHSQEGFRLKGKHAWLPVNLSILFRWKEKAHPRALLSLRDIGSRSRILEKMNLDQIRQQALLDNLSQCIFLKDRKLRFTAVNKAFCAGLGRHPEDILGRDDFSFYPAELAAKYQADDVRVLSQGIRLETEEQNLQGGTVRTVRVVKTPYHAPDGDIEGILGIFWDVTEQRHMEAQARHVQKMEAILRLAGGVAHDFNNLMTGILGHLELARRELTPHGNREYIGQLLERAETAGLRAGELTRQLLSFASRSIHRIEPLNLNDLLQDSLPRVQNRLGDNIRLQTRLEREVWHIRADFRLIEQILFNFCRNAADAMPLGGAILLETANLTLTPENLVSWNQNPAIPPPDYWAVEARPGDFVRLRIGDTGKGITPENLDHLFEPFFSTKEFGAGTGLALAMGYGIVREHDGWINCRTRVGEGTCFDIYFPRQGEGKGPLPFANPKSAQEKLALQTSQT